MGGDHPGLIHFNFSINKPISDVNCNDALPNHVVHRDVPEQVVYIQIVKWLGIQMRVKMVSCFRVLAAL